MKNSVAYLQSHKDDVIGDLPKNAKIVSIGISRRWDLITGYNREKFKFEGNSKFGEIDIKTNHITRKTTEGEQLFEFSDGIKSSHASTYCNALKRKYSIDKHINVESLAVEYKGVKYQFRKGRLPGYRMKNGEVVRNPLALILFSVDGNEPSSKDTMIISQHIKELKIKDGSLKKVTLEFLK